MAFCAYKPSAAWPDKGCCPAAVVLCAPASGRLAVSGVVGTKCIHLMTEEEAARAARSRAAVRVGADSAEQAAKWALPSAAPWC